MTAIDTMQPIEINVDMTSVCATLVLIVNMLIVFPIQQDTICPFCFIGKRKLDRAIAMAKEKGLNVQVRRKMHPFVLDPSLTGDSARDKRAHYINKFGEERFTSMSKVMRERAKEDGINM